MRYPMEICFVGIARKLIIFDVDYTYKYLFCVISIYLSNFSLLRTVLAWQPR